MRHRVVIVGGGISGLSAAHELIERGFDVHLYERRFLFGGKAASTWAGKSRDRPGEHGFRFYPGWYKHLPHTMQRIPYQAKTDVVYEQKTVMDNLVKVDTDLLTWYDKPPAPFLMHLPTSLEQVQQIPTLVSRLSDVGLKPGEPAFFLSKLAQYLAMPEDKRIEVLDQITWWDFLEADDRSKSEAYRSLISATTRTMVAAKATEASAYTIGKLAIRTFLDALSTIDRVCNGPTNDVWIDPWVKYLKAQGVVFHTGWELDTIEFNEKKGPLAAIERVTFTSTLHRGVKRALEEANEHLERLNGIATTMGASPALRPPKPDSKSAEQALNAAIRLTDEALGSSPAGKEIIAALKGVKTRLRTVMTAYSPGIAPATGSLSTAVKALQAILDPPGALGGLPKTMASDDPTGHSGRSPDQRTYFIFALPVEQMAYYINRTATMTYHDPSLLRVVELSDYTDWMAGVQYYLREPFDLVSGHLICMDSEWALTAIEETQFWRGVNDLDPDIHGVLSVDVAVWDRKGRFIQKEAYNCTNDEIATEVWNQLKANVNRDGETQKLRDDMLIHSTTGRLFKSGVNYHVDDSVVDIYDRKKRGQYEKARGVGFSADALTARTKKGQNNQIPFVPTGRLRFNVEPLLVNRVNSHALRPEVTTKISNMYLAGDWVLTNTDLACMEGANEAARRAVNAILQATGSTRERCKVWGFSASRDLLERVGGILQLGNAAALGRAFGGRMGAVAEAVSGVLGRFSGDLLDRGRPK